MVARLFIPTDDSEDLTFNQKFAHVHFFHYLCKKFTFPYEYYSTHIGASL